jgi:virulence activator alpha
MSLRSAILTALIERPSSGKELTRRIRRRRLQYLILQAGIDTELSSAGWCTKDLKKLVAERRRNSRRS